MTKKICSATKNLKKNLKKDTKNIMNNPPAPPSTKEDTPPSSPKEDTSLVSYASLDELVKSEKSVKDPSKIARGENVDEEIFRGLSILSSSSINVITTKVSFCAKSESTRGAWIHALKKNLSNLKTGS